MRLLLSAFKKKKTIGMFDGFAMVYEVVNDKKKNIKSFLVDML